MKKIFEYFEQGLPKQEIISKLGISEGEYKKYKRKWRKIRNLKNETRFGIDVQKKIIELEERIRKLESIFSVYPQPVSKDVQKFLDNLANYLGFEKTPKYFAINYKSAESLLRSGITFEKLKRVIKERIQEDPESFFRLVRATPNVTALLEKYYPIWVSGLKQDPEKVRLKVMEIFKDKGKDENGIK